MDLFSIGYFFYRTYAKLDIRDTGVQTVPGQPQEPLHCRVRRFLRVETG